MRIAVATAMLLLPSVPVFAAAVGVLVNHRAAGCLPAGRISVIEGSLVETGSSRGVRLYFRALGASAWHFTPVQVGPGGALRAFLPRPGPSASEVEYFFAVQGTDSRYDSSEVFRVRAGAAAICEAEGLRIAPTVDAAPLVIEPSELDLPVLPEGFLADGIGAAVSSRGRPLAGAEAEPGAGANGGEASELLIRGAEALQSGDAATALPLLERLLELLPSDPLAAELLERARIELRAQVNQRDEAKRRELEYLETALATAERIGDQALAAEYRRRIAGIATSAGYQSGAPAPALPNGPNGQREQRGDLSPGPTPTARPVEARPGVPRAVAPQSAAAGGVQWVRLPPGSFEMGCSTSDDLCDPHERPLHIVRLTRGLDIAATETTNRQYGACVDAGVCPVPREAGLFEDPTRQAFPVVAIGWLEAQTYCEWAGGRLPTEAEWEYAARGGLTYRYPWGDAGPICATGFPNGARFDDQAGCHDRGSVETGSFPPNAFGLYDMAGNVWEWVADWYDEVYYRRPAAQDPTGPLGGSYRVLRGGSWSSSEKTLRVSYRNWALPEERFRNAGFRCVSDAR